jgi:hypothetical protein
VPDKEHPASKAGRYVRAAGIVVGKEIDKRAAAAAAKPAPAPPAPPPPPPPPAKTRTFTGKAIFVYFVASIVVLVLTFLRAADDIPTGAQRIVRLCFSAILLFEAFLLLTNWQQANERIGQRLLTRMWGDRGPANKRERAVARVVKDGLTLLGIAFLAGGVYSGIVAFVGD